MVAYKVHNLQNFYYLGCVEVFVVGDTSYLIRNSQNIRHGLDIIYDVYYVYISPKIPNSEVVFPRKYLSTV